MSQWLTYMSGRIRQAGNALVFVASSNSRTFPRIGISPRLTKSLAFDLIDDRDSVNKMTFLFRQLNH